jgi:hypothetical protein
MYQASVAIESMNHGAALRTLKNRVACGLSASRCIADRGVFFLSIEKRADGQ